MSSSFSRRKFIAGALIAPAVGLLGCGGGSNNPGGGGNGVKNAVRSWTDMTHSAVIATKPSPPEATTLPIMIGDEARFGFGDTSVVQHAQAKSARHSGDCLNA